MAKKVNSKSAKSAPAVKGGSGLAGRISFIRSQIEANLGKYKDDYVILREEWELHNYLVDAIHNGIISIDTETTGLDPMMDKLVGISIYTPGKKAAYIPVRHKSYITGEIVDNQIDIKDVAQQFAMIPSSVEVIMFNAAFDTRVLLNSLGVRLKCTWDCYLASRCLNENEEQKNLKALYSKYCTNGDDPILRFDAFSGLGVTFDLIPINLGYIYAAHDAYMTYRLYEFQRPLLTEDNEECYSRDLQDVAWVFHNIEMPCVDVVVDMEQTGIELDLDMTAQLHDKYHKLLDEKTEEVYKTLDMYEAEIAEYRFKNPNCKLSDPINLGSPTQIAIVLYDVMGVKSVDKDSPRGTGEKILTKIDNAFTKALLEYRGIQKLIDTYIDKLPDCVNPNDGRIHCKFNQYGADTGRFSSSDPNLQNIPIRTEEGNKIRSAFCAADKGNRWVCSALVGLQSARTEVSGCAVQAFW